jgi:hypothetical protein
MVVLVPSESSPSATSGRTPLPQARRTTTVPPLEHHYRSTALSRSRTCLATTRSTSPTSPHHPQCHSTKVGARFGRFWSRRCRHSSNELAARRGRPLALPLSPFSLTFMRRQGVAKLVLPLVRAVPPPLCRDASASPSHPARRSAVCGYASLSPLCALAQTLALRQGPPRSRIWPAARLHRHAVPARLRMPPLCRHFRRRCYYAGTPAVGEFHSRTVRVLYSISRLGTLFSRLMWDRKTMSAKPRWFWHLDLE